MTKGMPLVSGEFFTQTTINQARILSLGDKAKAAGGTTGLTEWKLDKLQE